MPDKPIADLSAMTINEVAVCRRGMNPGATVALFKADTSPSLPTSNQEGRMSKTNMGAAPPGFTACSDCADPGGCSKAGACSADVDKGACGTGKDKKDGVNKCAPLVPHRAAPASDPFAKSAKEIMDDLFKGIANPAPALVAGVMKAVADAKDIGAAEVKKAQDAIAASNAALAKAGDDDAKTFGQVLPAQLVLDDWWTYNDALRTSLRSILESTDTDDSTKLQMVAASLDQFRNAMTLRMSAAIAAASAATNVLLKSSVSKSAGTGSVPAHTATINKEALAVTGTNSTPLTDTLAKAASVDDVLKALPANAAALVNSAIEKALATEPPKPEDAVAKAIASDPVLKARFEALEKAAAEASAIAKAEKDAREHTARVAKAGAEFGNLPVSAEAMANVLKSVEGIPDESVRKDLESILKGANEVYGTKILGGEIGKSSSAVSGTAMTEALAKAETLRKAMPSLSQEQALAKAYQDNPGLYDRVHAESYTPRTP